MKLARDLTCKDLVDLVTEYLECGLFAAERERYEERAAIVSDLALPDGSGSDVIREAKRCQRLTGVALTANDDEKDEVARGRDAGFDYHLTKPIDFAQLREVLAHIAPAHNGEVSFE